jgi:hypothetical protein
MAETREKIDTFVIPQALYDSEINFSISCYFDGGWIIKLGDDDNGWDAEMRVEPPLKFEDALERLKLLAIGYYPESDFAKRFG